MKFIRSVIAQDESISASDVKTYDLPVNPLSYINLTVRGFNVTDEMTLAEILEKLERIKKGLMNDLLTGIKRVKLDS